MNIWSERELEEAAKKELGEDKNRLKEDLSALHDWINKSPHLQQIRKDDVQLIWFLRGCKFSLERAKEKLDFHNSCKYNLPNWFKEWDIEGPVFQKFLDWGNWFPLPGYDKHGRMVILMRPGQVVPDKTNIEEMLMTTQAFYELACVSNVQAQINGVIILNDLANMTAQHALMFSPAMAKKGITLFQDAYPSRPQAMHFLNFPSLMQAVFNMMQGFLKEKMRKRNKVHMKGDYSALYEDIGKDVLPVEYGGSNGTVEDIKKNWTERVMSNKEWFKEQTKFKSDETKRPGKPKSHADLFGIEGSFRKLEID